MGWTELVLAEQSPSWSEYDNAQASAHITHEQRHFSSLMGRRDRFCEGGCLSVLSSLQRCVTVLPGSSQLLLTAPTGDADLRLRSQIRAIP
jgi:hypothetical protein